MFQRSKEAELAASGSDSKHRLGIAIVTILINVVNDAVDELRRPPADCLDDASGRSFLHEDDVRIFGADGSAVEDDVDRNRK